MSKSHDLTTSTHGELVRFILDNAPSAQLLKHRASKTSEESLEVRYEASGEMVTGAKALLIKLDVGGRPNTFAVIVLPGFNKLDSKATKKHLKELISGFRSFRFATAEEMVRHARGIQPGKMPPFGRPLFPDISYTFIDQALLEHARIGFNAADFERSIIMDTAEYVKLVVHDDIFSYSEVVEQ